MTSLTQPMPGPECVLVTDNFPPRLGGVSRYYAGLAASYGPAMTVYSPLRNNAGVQQLRMPDGNTRRGQLAQSLFALRIARLAPNKIVLLGHPHLGLLSPFMRQRKTLGIFIHGGEWQEFPHLNGILTRIESQCDFLFVNSAASAATWINTRLADRIVIIRPGLDAEWLKAGSTASRRRRNGHRAPPVRLLTVARLVPRKGVLELANLVTALSNDGVPVALRIIGDGPMLSPLLRKFENVSCIDLVGAVSESDLHAAYEWADAFVLCPMLQSGGEGFEGFGIVYLEAAAYGLPIIATSTGGVREALNSEGSFIARPGDWRGIGGQIRSLANMSPLRRDEMGALNISWASQNSWTTRSNTLANALSERIADGWH